MKRGRAYEGFVRPLLFALDPETAHHFALRVLRAGGTHLPLRQFQPKPKPTTVFGITFRIRSDLRQDSTRAAWPCQHGPRSVSVLPRSERSQLNRNREIRGRASFVSRAGSAHQSTRLQQRRRGDRCGEIATVARFRRWPRIPIGINIGKSKATPLEAAVEDYLFSFRKLVSFADYVALNVSSPNTPGLRALQEKEALSHLLSAIGEQNAGKKPVLLKIAPDLSEPELSDVIEVCETNAVAGLIATNTTIDHTAIPKEQDEEGGLSGKPLGEKSTAMIRAIRAQTRLPIIASGGIFDADSAREKMHAGAQLLQVYTGYIYRGPGLVREIVEQLES